jgi:hypothetical protein
MIIGQNKFSFKLPHELEGLGEVGCGTFNIIYIIVCKKCKSVYVGESHDKVINFILLLL